MQVAGPMPVGADVLHQVMCCRDENQMQNILKAVHMQAQKLASPQQQQRNFTN
jgi:hypothetical protein